ncbi:DNA-binding protein [Tessaracoccus aquimaris]|uniref:DNA-binding protein n=1 Tax=Tessaracoccus aquimaris TaxID=1332264 RepID=A0A1Q2CME4_9ACTN|nr:DNA-binding protein [Tessaracoccus aquimaris]AQP47283.1 DNA-binding protein [Tessaracoccus aquimaris]
MKTLAIRLDDDVHARLVILAKLADVSLTDAIRQAIESQIQVMSSDPALSAKAEALREEIDREAREQQGALSLLFGATTEAAPAKAPSSTTTARPRKS